MNKVPPRVSALAYAVMTSGVKNELFYRLSQLGPANFITALQVIAESAHGAYPTSVEAPADETFSLGIG